MIDIRPIKEHEAERFLHLICEVFGLDENRAYNVFFNEPYFDLGRKWALFEGPEMVSILTVTPIIFGWGEGIGIAGVATQNRRRSEGHASRLIERVLAEYEKRGKGRALLFARDTRLYDQLGFEALDRVIRAPIRLRPEDEGRQIAPPEARPIYDAWAASHPDRMRRDDQRWGYWNWHYRVCTGFQDGYLCHEVNVLREALFTTPEETLPLPVGTEWYGTTFMADQLGIPVYDAKVELYLMGRHFPGIPQMFMTDQF